jgi:hypothetical protein
MRWILLFSLVIGCTQERTGPDKGCETVAFCQGYVGPDGGGLAQCVLPWPAGQDTPEAEAYLSCVGRSGMTGGSCATACADKTVGNGCSPCLVASCSAEREACGL